jgi:hypothetical protein
MSTSTYEIEMTDTFGGEANYSWVRRCEISVKDSEHFKKNDSQLIRLAKKELDISGIRHKKSDCGDCIRLDLVGMCQVVFITYKD